MYFQASSLALVAAAFVGSCHGQTTFLDGPQESWSTDFSPMSQGNGIVVAPDNSLLYATASDGTLGALDPSDGSIVWSHRPSGVDFLNGYGQASVAMDGSYVVYAVTENLNLPSESCKVVALSPSSGEPLWTSPALTGACQGTPHISSDGDYVYVAHNSAGFTVGHFTVLIHDQDGAVLFDMSDANGPFSPPGIYHSPLEGNFGAGRGNNQDLLMWSNAPTPDATSGQQGSVFAFQLPFNYVQDLGTDILEVQTLIPTVGWRSTTPPLLTGLGLQLFWSVSRSQFRSWVNTRFTASSSGSVGFDRGTPSFLAPQNTPAVDNDMTPTTLCSGTAGPEFVCMDATNINTGAIWSVDTAGLILADPLFSTEGDRVYFAEDRGVIFSVDPQTGDKYFEKSTGVPLTSNFALSEDGAFLYYGDQIGNVVAWKIAEEAIPPTPAPVAVPTDAPTAKPSMEPSAEAPDTSMPTGSPVASPTNPRVEPTASPPPPTNPAVEPTSAATRQAIVSAMLAGAVAAMLL